VNRSVTAISAVEKAMIRKVLSGGSGPLSLEVEAAGLIIQRLGAGMSQHVRQQEKYSAAAKQERPFYDALSPFH
jgi:hypothetical protein